jgi:small-conductance mechanosensitive channel
MRLLRLLLALLAVTPLIAQESPSTEGEAPAAAPSPAIRTEEIPRRATEDLARIQEVRNRTDALAAVDAYSRRFARLRARADSLGALPELRNPEDAEALRLQEVLAVTDGVRNTFRDLTGNLEGRARELGDLAAELAGRETAWSATVDSADARALSEELRARVRSTGQEIGDMRSAVLAGRDRVLALSDSVTAALLPLERQVEAGNRELEARSLEQAAGPTAPPLWRLGEYDESARTRGVHWDIVQTRSRIGLGYLETHLGRVFAQFLFWLLLLALALRARGRMEQLGFEGTRASRMLRNPIASAVLFAIVLTPLFHPSAPMILHEQTDGIVLVCLLLLARALFPPGVRRWAYGTMLLFLVYRTADVLLDEGLPERLIRLGMETVLLAGAVVLYARWPALAPRDKGWPALRVAVAAALALAAVALGANLLGNVGLDRLLLGGILNNIYTGMVLLAAATLFRLFLRVGLRSPGLGHLHSVRAHQELIEARLVGVFRALLWVAWFLLLLVDFGVWMPVRTFALDLLAREFTLGTVTLTAGGILGFFVAVWLTVQVAGLLRFLLGKEILPRFRLERGIPEAISTLTNYVVLVVGFLLALAVLGVELSRITLLVRALGVGIGFGLQNVVNNFVSGLILTFERPVQVGDTVQSGTFTGRITRIGVRSSTLRTWDGAEVIVPNGDLISKEVINWTLSDTLRRMELRVGVAYGTDPERVIGILESTVREREGVLTDPAPYALFVAFGESSLDFLLRYWVQGESDWLRTHSDTHRAVNAALAEAGIRIPFPQRDLHVIERPSAPDTDG